MLALLLVHLTVGCSNFGITTIPSPSFSGFEKDNEDWEVSKGGKSRYSSTGGNPDGYLEGIDTGENAWYFVAPTRFINEAKFSYGRTLSFDLKQSATDDQVHFADLILTDSLTTLTFNTPDHPKTTWTHYAVKLDECQGWKKGKTKATQADIQAVLKNLKALHIRGEFRAGPDIGGLDNVSL
ncbi:hypothetical protein GCM10027085_25150 [Spirosoma aerophilum]